MLLEIIYATKIKITNKKFSKYIIFNLHHRFKNYN